MAGAITIPIVLCGVFGINLFLSWINNVAEFNTEYEMTFKKHVVRLVYDSKPQSKIREVCNNVLDFKTRLEDYERNQ